MPFDVTQPLSSASARSSRRKTPDLTLGVFNDGRHWKVYSQFGSPILYATRQEALIAAEERAFEAARAGREVELFVQDEDGALRQAQIELQ